MEFTGEKEGEREKEREEIEKVFKDGCQKF